MCVAKITLNIKIQVNADKINFVTHARYGMQYERCIIKTIFPTFQNIFNNFETLYFM